MLQKNCDTFPVCTDVLGKCVGMDIKSVGKWWKVNKVGSG